MKLLKALCLTSLSSLYAGTPDGTPTQQQNNTVAVSAAAAAAVALTQEDVIAQLTEGMNENNRRQAIAAIRKVAPLRYQIVTNACRALTEGMDEFSRRDVIMRIASIDSPLQQYTNEFIRTCLASIHEINKFYPSTVIKIVSELNPSHYEAFISTCRILAEEMNGGDEEQDEDYNPDDVIYAISGVDPLHYEAFISTCRLLTNGRMKGINRNDIISAISIITPLHYENFVRTCRALTNVRMNETHLRKTIEIVACIQDPLWPFFLNFTRQNPRFFTYVPFNRLHQEIEDLRRKGPITQNNLQALLTRLHIDYFRQVPGMPDGLAFGIHNFADQPVQADGVTKTFNDAVLDKVMELLGDRPSLSYEEAKGTMQSMIDSLIREDQERLARGEALHYSDTLAQEVFDWATTCVEDSEMDARGLAAVVTYLHSRGAESFKAWLASFMDESKKAYRTGSTASCRKGVKERVITSLRNTNDPAFADLFGQAEAKQMLKVKMATLNNFDLWAKRLRDAGIRATTPALEAKTAYLRAMTEFFADVKTPANGAEIDATIEVMMDCFEDSVTVVEGREVSEQGAWSKIIRPGITRLESAVITPEQLAFNEFITAYTADDRNSWNEMAYIRAAMAYWGAQVGLNADAFRQIAESYFQRRAQG